ncbi:MAG: DUF554 domain-containing protein [Verrucomicrobiota bacterium]|nr:DUF554 domain-containing protein [Verrucomicrobiota bacterium]
MIGTILNTLSIVVGGGVGLFWRGAIPEKVEQQLKLLLGALVLYVGITTIWKGINGPFFSVLAQVGIALLSLILGNAIGMLLKIQDRLNRLGQWLKKKMGPESDANNRFSEGFVTCSLLFCVGPMAIIGALQDGLTGNYRTLAIKSVMDGLAALAFARTFGVGVLFSALPLLAYQGTISLASRNLAPILEHQALLDSINATGGLLLLCVSVVVFGVQKVPLANYLPSLLIAPLLTWWWR